jgi:hypothetical protein
MLFDHGPGHIQPLGNFRVRQAFELAQQETLSTRLTELSQRSAHQGQALFIHRTDMGSRDENSHVLSKRRSATASTSL